MRTVPIIKKTLTFRLASLSHNFTRPRRAPSKMHVLSLPEALLSLIVSRLSWPARLRASHVSRELLNTVEAWAMGLMRRLVQRASPCFSFRAGEARCFGHTISLWRKSALPSPSDHDPKLNVYAGGQSSVPWRSMVRGAEQAFLYTLGGVSVGEFRLAVDSGHLASAGPHGVNVYRTSDQQRVCQLPDERDLEHSGSWQTLCVSGPYLASRLYRPCEFTPTVNDDGESSEDAHDMCTLRVFSLPSGTLHMDLPGTWGDIDVMCAGPNSTVFYIERFARRSAVRQLCLETGQLVGSCSLPHDVGAYELDFTQLLFRADALLMNCIVRESTVDEVREDALQEMGLPEHFNHFDLPETDHRRAHILKAMEDFYQEASKHTGCHVLAIAALVPPNVLSESGGQAYGVGTDAAASAGYAYLPQTSSTATHGMKDGRGHVTLTADQVRLARHKHDYRGTGELQRTVEIFRLGRAAQGTLPSFQRKIVLNSVPNQHILLKNGQLFVSVCDTPKNGWCAIEVYDVVQGTCLRTLRWPWEGARIVGHGSAHTRWPLPELPHLCAMVSDGQELFCAFSLNQARRPIAHGSLQGPPHMHGPIKVWSVVVS